VTGRWVREVRRGWRTPSCRAGSTGGGLIASSADAQLAAYAAGRWSRRDGRWGEKAWRELAEDAIELRWPAVAGRTRARTVGATARVVAETKIKKK
jgi:hypothetical protein